MLQIHTRTRGRYQTNCYLICPEGTRHCLIIDPGYEAAVIEERLAALGLRAEAILLTHGHFDHVGAVRQIAAETGCRVFLQEEDLSLPPSLTDGPLYYTDLYPASGTLSLAGMEVRILHTPGHTPGSVCIIIDDVIFSGDTLFAGSIGRCDFPGSSIFRMRKSLAKLKSLTGDYRVFPGHGEATTLNEEKQNNPYL